MPAPRYGIAEWFGKDISSMTAMERQATGKLAAMQYQEESLAGAPICPFLAALIPGAQCNKVGGVCSIRRFDESGVAIKGEHVATTCPSRFLQSTAQGKSIFSTISEKMLDIPNATLVKETPFLRKIDDSQRTPDLQKDLEAEAKEEKKKAGRIDWILVDPKTIDAGELEWCAVETQALYFSGQKMRMEFDAYAHAAGPVLFPVGKRRPDYRSSGPKRLWPQLDVKVPVLRNWKKKVAIVVDKFFFKNMNALADPFPRMRDERDKRENADVAWFIVDYNEDMCLHVCEVIYTTLENSRTALNATEPLSKAEFTKNLISVMRDPNRIHKVFKASKEAAHE